MQDDKEDENNDIVETYNKILELEKAIDKHHQTIELIQDAIVQEISSHPENEKEIFKIFNPRIEFFIGKIQFNVGQRFIF